MIHALSRTAQDRSIDAPFLVATLSLFAASVAATIAACDAMPTMSGMSMTWMRMPGQTWFDAAGMFVGMWTVMMIAMMLPSLAPTLARYRRDRSLRHRDRKTVAIASGYFLVWSLLGVAMFPFGVGISKIAMQPPIVEAIPCIAGFLLVIAGALQFTRWKMHQLDCCTNLPTCRVSVGDFHTGLRLGLHCCCCCIGPTIALLIFGVMDLRTMAVVGTAITLERTLPNGHRIARIAGAIAIVVGVFVMVGIVSPI
jgi:predicted metal-binding membrane protein